MSAILGFIATLLLLVVVVWLLVFGGIGALLAPRRGRTAMSGFLWGAFLGPVGWAVVLIRPGAVRNGIKRLPEIADNASLTRRARTIEDEDDEFTIR